MKDSYKSVMHGILLLFTTTLFVFAADVLNNSEMASRWLNNNTKLAAAEHNEIVSRRFIKPRDSFGCSDAEFVRCSGQELAFVEAPNISCALYRKDNRALIVVSNQQNKSLQDIVNLNLGKIFTKQSTGFLYKLKAFNAENGEKMEMELVPAEADCYAEIPVKIPAGDFCLIELKPNP